jgi:protein TonB
MKYLLFLFLFSSVNSFGQDVYEVPYISPEFPGGNTKMNEFIAANYAYPKVERESKITGIIWVSCFIEIDGSLTDIKIERGLSNLLDEEAVRVIGLMPKWKPGKEVNGKIERVKYNIPIKIK